MSKIVEDLSKENIATQRLNDRVVGWVRDLAQLTLCKRFHRKDQVQDVVGRWTLAMSNYIAEGRDSRESEEPIVNPAPVPQMFDQDDINGLLRL